MIIVPHRFLAHHDQQTCCCKRPHLAPKCCIACEFINNLNKLADYYRYWANFLTIFQFCWIIQRRWFISVLHWLTNRFIAIVLHGGCSRVTCNLSTTISQTSQVSKSMPNCTWVFPRQVLRMCIQDDCICLRCHWASKVWYFVHCFGKWW